MKLISLREYVLEIDKTYSPNTNQWYRCLKYSNFLSQNLELWMFVPCKFVEGVWVVLEEPKAKDFYTPMPDRNGKKAWKTNREKFDLALKEYQEAKYRVLFEGFEVFKSVSALISFSYNAFIRLDWSKEGNFMMGFSTTATIEDLVKYNLELTPTAQKQIGCV